MQALDLESGNAKYIGRRNHRQSEESWKKGGEAMSLSKFHHPFEFMGRPQLEPEVKRAILASWICDAHAAENRPDLRRPPGGSQVNRLVDKTSAMRSADAHEA
jgi:hypothetical protein